MSEKKIVVLTKVPVLPYAMDYLTYCTHCSTYGLGERKCSKCDKIENVSLDIIAEKTVHRHLVIRIGIALIAYALLYVLSINLLQLFFCTFFLGLLIVANIFIYKKYKKQFIARELELHINANIDKIKQDLKNQLQAAINEVDQDNLDAAYDRLRYLSNLMDNEEIRTFKLICLRQFDLRSDMPLEMNSLLQKDCNTYLLDYIYEVSKVRKDLIDEDTILYMLEFKEQVLTKKKGPQMMASILEASLRSKYLLAKYAKYMLGYVRYFSKERLLRLCKMSHCIEDKVVRYALIEEVKEIVGNDDDFTKYFAQLEEA